MRLSLMILIAAVFLGSAQQQEEEKKPPVDPFADPVQELARRVAQSEKQKRYDDLRAAAAELKVISQEMSDEIEAGSKDVISARIWTNLDRAEKLIKTMREKSK